MNQTQKLDAAATPPAFPEGDGPEQPAVEPASAGIEIAGYELLEKLGAGGYGEVWKAIGPGGLPKAVKILFGEKTGQHAAVELKALQRMRELRHPFLLSIERIEVIENRLIVVTELADKNLSDEFDDCRRKGQAGIERDVLVRHLADVADALDYMYEQHGLQHLDIKPDNILLQGDRAKVGDFGLAKDISRSDVSMLNGFTPMYAAPELFEGNPGVGSDQYSLAMMYMMMLTGKLPFTGRTPAQLMSQHMKSPPDLSPLQPVDRPVIARALSKNPNARFDSNKAFVEELSRRKASRSTRTVSSASARPNDPKTEVVDVPDGGGVARPDLKPSQPRSFSPVAAASDTPLRTSAFIGIGGLAAVALRELKVQQSMKKEENPEGLFPSLLIDSDRDTLTQARSATLTVGLTPDETLHTPLKKSKEYKSNSNLDLSWLSRRWLFNIPRSGNVDGIRPLGRLVLADHQEQVRDRLAEVLSSAVDEDNVKAASQHNGVTLNSQALDVYVVASSTGGTSSGMVADVGLMVQAMARRHNIKDIQVHCILLHGTGLNRSAADVQEANTLSLLKELRHLSTPGLGSPRGFKGDSHSLDDCPFTSCRLVPLGEGASETVLAQRAQQVGRFLFDASTTPAQLDFQAWQDQQQEATLGPGCLQVVGLDQQDTANIEAASAQANRLTVKLLEHWIQTAQQLPEENEVTVPKEEMRLLLTNLNLTESTLPNQIMSILQGETGQEVQACADELLDQIRNQADGEPLNQSQLLQSITELGFCRQSDGDQRTIIGIVNEVSGILESARSHSGDLIAKQLFELLDSPGRLGAMRTAGSVANCELERTTDVCSRMREKIESAFDALTNNASEETILSKEEELDQCRQYCTLLAWQLVYRCFIDHLEALDASVQQQMDRLNELVLSLAEAATGLTLQPEAEEHQEAQSESSMDGEQNAPDQNQAEDISEDQVHELDRYIRGRQETLLSGHLRSNAQAQPTINQLKTMCQQFLIAAGTSDSDEAAPRTSQKQFPATAWPRIGRVGGTRRVLGLIPEVFDQADWKRRLQQEFGDCIGVRTEDSERMSIYCEIDEVPYESIMTALSFNRAHVEEVACRVHTRIDVDW